VGAASYSPKAELSHDLLDTVRSVLSASRRKRGHTRLIKCMKESSFAFELESDVSLIAPLVCLVQEKVTEAELGDDADCLRLGIAFEEALTNAMYHGNLEMNSELRQNDDREYYDLALQRAKQPPYCDRRVFVETRHSSDEVRIVIRDEGPGFDPASLPDPTDPENLERAFGRGMLLITTFMDEVKHNEQGNEITMIKRRGHADNSAG
jgi:anti-sigma regulatory factor (Ser/Thr protein kinase)